MDEEKEMICDNCETNILNEKDMYEIEPLGYMWCEECMSNYMDGPTDDLLDDLAEDLKML